MHSRVIKDPRQLHEDSLAYNSNRPLPAPASHVTGKYCCSAVDKFQEGCGQTIETSKKYEMAVTELAEARSELADTSVALAQAQRDSKHLRQRLVGPCHTHILSTRPQSHPDMCSFPKGSKDYVCPWKMSRLSSNLHAMTSETSCVNPSTCDCVRNMPIS